MPQPIEPKVIGFPTAETVMVSREDIVSIVRYVSGLHDWVAAASSCIKASAEPTFAGTVSEFVGGK